MAHAALADLQARYGADEILQLTDRNSDGLPDADVYGPALDDASTEVDAYLAAITTLPLTTPVPDLVVFITCEIARYRLWKDLASDEVRRRYEDAARQLREIAARRVKLPGLEPAQGPASPALVSTPGRVFGEVMP